MLVHRIALMTAVIGLGAVAGDAAPGQAGGESSANTPANQLRFYQTKDGLTFADAWGDPATGPHSNFIRLPGSYGGSLHVHTFSYYGVVIGGTVSNERRGQADQPLEPGSYWFQSGGELHVTKCLSAADCLIFVTSRGKFDIRSVVDSVAPPTETSELPR